MNTNNTNTVALPESQKDIFYCSEVEVNPREDSSWTDVKCGALSFNKFMDNISFDYEKGTLTITIPMTVFVPDLDAQKDLKALLTKWSTEGKKHLIEALGCAISGNCSDRIPCTCEDILDYLGEEKKLPTETHVFDLNDCTFYKYS